MIKHEKKTTEDDNKKETEDNPNKKQKICEFEIYKQAAEIEKHLKEDKP